MVQDFFRFYDEIYVPDHAAPLNRWVHFLSNMAALFCCTTGLLTGFLPLFLLGIWFQLGPPYLGHIAFEKTHRSIDQNPIWAAVGSWYTTSQILLGKQSVTHGPVPWTPPAPTDHGALRRAVDRHGRNLHGFMALEDGLEHWHDPEGDAAAAFVRVPGHWVAVGPPLCAEHDRQRAADAFALAARREGAKAVFFGVGPAWFDGAGVGFDRIPVGRTPVWNPRRWAECIDDGRKLRNRLRCGERHGTRVRAVAGEELRPGGDLHAALVEVVTGWIQGRALPPMGFMTRLDLAHDTDARRTFVALGPEGEVRGFAFFVPVPGRGGWLLEDLLVPRTAAPGTAERLIDHGMRTLADEGAELVTLGMVVGAELPEDPRHPTLRRWMAACTAWGRGLYPAQGLVRFRRKLRPHDWEPVYVVADGQVTFTTLVAVLRAFTGGLVLFALHAVERAVARRLGPVVVHLRPCQLRRRLDALWCRFVCPWLPAGWGHA